MAQAEVPGLYIVFEGADGTGKSSTMTAVYDHFVSNNADIIATHHPGSTSLGKHIRKLVKTPELIDPNIKIDEYSRQILYMVDNISFIKQILEPSIDKGTMVFADRSSFISAMVYGLASDLSIAELDSLLRLVVPPKINRLYVFHCSPETAMERIKKGRWVDGKQNIDHFDSKGIEFHTKLMKYYLSLSTIDVELMMMLVQWVSLNNIVYVDTENNQQDIVNFIIDDISKLTAEHKFSYSA